MSSDAADAARSVPLTVADLMTRDVVHVEHEETVATVRDLMSDARIRHLPVVDENKDLVGIISDRDLLQACRFFDEETTLGQERHWLEGMKASDIMTEQVATVPVDLDVREAAQTLFELKIGCLPVTDGDGVGRLAGILTESDFVRLFAEGE